MVDMGTFDALICANCQQVMTTWFTTQGHALCGACHDKLMKFQDLLHVEPFPKKKSCDYTVAFLREKTHGGTVSWWRLENSLQGQPYTCQICSEWSVTYPVEGVQMCVPCIQEFVAP
jgi:hypothetical protein